MDFSKIAFLRPAFLFRKAIWNELQWGFFNLCLAALDGVLIG